MKSKGLASTIEKAGIVFFVSGFALYIAIDSGVVKFPVQRMAESAQAHAGQAAAHLTRLQELNKKVETVEAKVKERFASLKQTDVQLDQIEKKIRDEKTQVNSISGVIEEVERARQALEAATKTDAERIAAKLAEFDAKAELERSAKPKAAPLGPIPSAASAAPASEKEIQPKASERALRLSSLSEDLLRVARAAHYLGVPKKNITVVTWDERDYLRLQRPFGFFPESHYLSANDVDAAQDLSKAIRKSDVAEVRVVFNTANMADGAIERQRAITLRNHFRKLVGKDTAVTLMRAPNETVSPGSIEVWVTKE